MKTKTEEKITKEMLIADLVDQYPKLAEVLVEQYGFHCIGCSLSAVETLGEGAMGHGFDKKTIEKMVIEMNKLVNKEETGRKKK
jgi:hybrid cluster-associated redox disulfide protein